MAAMEPCICLDPGVTQVIIPTALQSPGKVSSTPKRQK
jgi:hypothetical protein